MEYCTNLRELYLPDNGEISTLANVANCAKLRHLWFNGTSPRDGDLRFIHSLKHLETLTFANKKWFSSTREDFWSRGIGANFG